MAIHIATTVNGRQYVVLVDGKAVAGPFDTATEAVQARDALLEAGRVAARDNCFFPGGLG